MPFLGSLWKTQLITTLKTVDALLFNTYSKRKMFALLRQNLIILKSGFSFPSINNFKRLHRLRFFDHNLLFYNW